MNQLEEARKEIDAVDREMANLYTRRLDAVTKVLQYKKEHGLPILDAKREGQVIEKNVGQIENPNYKRPYRDFVKMMMRNSREYQQTLLSNDVIAYCGVKGAFGHLATERLVPGSPTIHFESKSPLWGHSF